MINIKLIRDNPTLLDNSLARRQLPPKSHEILALHQALLSLKTQADHLKQQRNTNASITQSIETGQPRNTNASITQSIETGQSHNTNASITQSIETGQHLKQQITLLDQQIRTLEQQLEQQLLDLPNLAHETVPQQDTVVKISDIPIPSKTFDHTTFIAKDKGVLVAGSRFTALEGPIATLARKLGHWLLEQNIQAGYVEMHTPYIMNREIAQGMGVLPKFQEDLFQLTNGQFLIPTAESSILGTTYQQNIPLPYLYTALTPCFRSEAGSAGRDTTGLIRLHQFSKVEIAGFISADQEDYHYQQLLNHVESLLIKLQLHYRIVEIGILDLGFHAQKKYDFEVWMPSLQKFVEISSCSKCGDFQARRLQLKNKPLPHSINGSSLPIDRLLAAILENHGPTYTPPTL